MTRIPVIVVLCFLAIIGHSPAMADDVLAPLGLWPEAVVDEELARLRAAAEASSDEPTPWLLLATAYGGRNMWRDCLAGADRAVAIAPALAEAHTERAACALNGGDAEDARISALRGARLAPRAFYPQFILGWANYQTERYDAAIDAFRNAVALDPQQAWGHYSLAVACSSADEFRCAVSELESALENAPDERLRPVAERLLAVSRGVVVQATEPYRKLVEDEPEKPEAHALLGDAYLRVGYYADALREYDSALTLLPRDHASHDSAQHSLLTGAKFRRGVALRGLRRWDESLAVFQDVLLSQPDQSETLYNIGLAYIGKGEPSKAVEPLTKAAELAPEKKGPHLSLADAYEALGDGDRARLEREHAATLP